MGCEGIGARSLIDTAWCYNIRIYDTSSPRFKIRDTSLKFTRKSTIAKNASRILKLAELVYPTFANTHTASDPIVVFSYTRAHTSLCDAQAASMRTSAHEAQTCGVCSQSLCCIKTKLNMHRTGVGKGRELAAIV